MNVIDFDDLTSIVPLTPPSDAPATLVTDNSSLSLVCGQFLKVSRCFQGLLFHYDSLGDGRRGDDRMAEPPSERLAAFFLQHHRWNLSHGKWVFASTSDFF